MLLNHITTRIEGHKDDDLLGKKGGNGFPFLVFLDAEGNVIAKHGGARSVDGFEQSGKKAKAYLELKKKADSGDKAAKVDFTLAKLELNASSMSLEAAKKEIDALGELGKEQKAKADTLLAEVEVMATLKGIGRDKAARLDAGKKFLDMKKAGRIPQSEDAMQPFWILMMDYAEDQKDVATFEEALKAMRARFGDNPNAKKFFDDRDKRLEALKAGGK